MPGDNPGHARRPAWKAAAEGPAPKGQRYAWKPEETAERRPRRRLKQVLIGVGAFTCVALMVYIIYLLQRPPHFGLVILGTDPLEDAERLDAPPDIEGWQGGRQLTDWAVDVAANHKSRWGQLTPEVLGTDTPGPVSLRAKDFPTLVDKLAKSRCDPLVVVLALHGAAGPDGPYLFTAGGERLPLKTVIDAFASARFRDRKVVLVLDPARLTPDPTLGVLHNDCVRSLKTLEPAIKDAASKLLVICASGPGQRSWNSEEWRSSAFTHALLDGLRGAAAPPGQTTITAWDLFDHVKRQTETWTAINRPTRQTPLLLPDPDGGGRARAEAITVALKLGDSVSTDPPGAKFQPPKELLERWQEWKDLDKAVPSPAVYTPRLWRRYRELLLRYEHLVRADERPAAAKLSQVLHNLSVDLEEARSLRRDSGSAVNALPLSGAYGFANLTVWSDADNQKFVELWNNRTKPDVRDLWQKFQKESPADALRLRLTSFLVRRAGDPNGAPEDADAAADLLRTVYAADPAAVRPAEAHFLLMVRAFDWAGQKPTTELLKRAAAVRLLAERAAVGMQPPGGDASGYPYSEQVWPVVRTAVVDGDRQRREGEDRLFTNRDQWPESTRQLDAAANLYDNAFKDARLLQNALATRDRALADLPFLTRWLASQRPEETRPHDPVALWDKVHALDAKLTELTRQSDKGAAPVLDPDQLAALTAAVRGPYQKLAEQFREQSELARIIGTSRLQQNWQQIEQLLTAPLIEPTLRVQLIENSRAMTAKFNEAKSPPAEGAAPTTDEPPNERAKRQGLLALAVLGNALLDAQAGPDLLRAEALRDRLTDLSGDWEPAVNRAGDQIGKHWQALAADPANDLVAAEWRSRTAVGFTSPAEDPALDQRRLRWQRLLVGLARRTFLDHWYSESRDADPYFVLAANRFLKDAGELVRPGADGRKPAVPGADEVAELLKTPPLKLVAEPLIDWNDQPSRTLEYSVEAAPALKGNGFVTLWPQPPNTAREITFRPADRRREPAEVGDARRKVQMDVQSSTYTAKAAVGLQGFYRGQRLAGETIVQLDRTPIRILTSITPPDYGGFAVRADKNFRGAVAIVLDYSGSMGERPSGPRDYTKPDSKFQQMLQVLPKVLADVPSGTNLSVRLYGHLPMPTSAPGAPPENAPEDRKNIFWTPLTENVRIFQEVVAEGPKKAEQLDKLMKMLKDLKPQGFTPLVHTMKEALAKDFPKDVPRTLLVLTDGADTWYGLNDPQKQAKREFEEAFRDADVTVQVVVFKANSNEVKIANEQFAEVANFPLPGSIEMAEDAKSLSEKLDVALRPKLRLVGVDGSRVRGVPRLGLPASAADAPLINLRPSGPIAPGQYDGYAFRSRQMIRFDPGDRLLISLLNSADGVRFRRDPLADDKLWENKTKAQGDWILGVPQVRDEINISGRRLRLMATLESTATAGRSPGKGGVLKQTWPRSTWWEVEPLGAAGASPKTLRVNPLYDYPAPAWDIIRDDWPADPLPRRVHVNVWCHAELPPVAKSVAITPNSPPQDVDLGDGQKVNVTVTLEPHPLHTGAVSADVQPLTIPCLVVRIRHAVKDRPIMVQLGALAEGVSKPAEEHRYFGSVNYTALFGPLTAAQVGGKPVELAFVSVAKLKAGATPISIDLPAPRRDEERPRAFNLEGNDR